MEIEINPNQNVQEFMIGLFAETKKFETFWARRNIEDPDTWPTSMKNSDWFEVFMVWLRTA